MVWYGVVEKSSWLLLVLKYLVSYVLLILFAMEEVAVDSN
jgi:hypothetical protein